MRDPGVTDAYVLLEGDCRTVLATIEDQSIDAIVTDPPYELGFMGKRWDASGIAYDAEVWAQCLRVLKPGGHLLAFGGTRTYHRMTVAIEDAGFEIRDSIHWLYGSGFPKSLDVSKAIDKAAGAEREVVGSRKKLESFGKGNAVFGGDPEHGGQQSITAPATDAARTWEGWGTALKPAHEPIVVARKPLAGTVAATVLEHGTGALNIDGCRVGGDAGRWPTNFILTHAADCGDVCANGCPVAILNRQSGITRSGSGSGSGSGGIWSSSTGKPAGPQHGDSGGASRFFTVTEWDPTADAPFRYVAKPGKKERNAGLEGLEERNKYKAGGVEGTGGMRSVDAAVNATPVANHHPTVKPIALMRWLVRLVTPPGGTVLDPFAGSGTTLVAAILEERHPIGIELTGEYHSIIHHRCQKAANNLQRILF